MNPHASALVTLGIGGIAAFMAILFFAAAWRTLQPGRLRTVTMLAAGAWCLLATGLAASGALANTAARPPPLGFLMLGTLACGLGLGFSAAGKQFAQKLPLGILVLSQSFRLPLEWVMHQAAQEHVMPVELSYTGYNFDIITGGSALLVGVLALKGPAPRSLVWLWNIYGSLMLVVITVIAIATSPFVAAFGEGSINTWVTRLPFVWLPAVLVSLAIAGHVVIFRRLRRDI